jgi:hydroxyacylglutathione hydrolase
LSIFRRYSYNKRGKENNCRRDVSVEQFIQIVPNIYRLTVSFSACWTGVTLITGEQNVLIDSGACAQTVDEEIVPALQAMGMSLKDIGWLSVTHTHGDHVGGCARLHALAPDMKIAVFHQSQKRFENPLNYSKAIRARFPAYSPPAPKVLDGVTPDLLLWDGDPLGELTLIHTPGHDTDCCCFWDGRTNTLITGDSLQLNGTVTQGCALLMNLEGYRKTLQKLLKMPVENIVCGHPFLPLGSQAVGKEASRHYLEQCENCDAIYKEVIHNMYMTNVTDAVQIAKNLIREIGGDEPDYLFLPLYTVTEYMQKGDSEA